jgi:hypothetical protein
MVLGVILTTSDRVTLCELAGKRLADTLQSFRRNESELKAFVVLADDGSAICPTGPWDLIVRHPSLVGIQRSFSSAYAALAPWSDVIWHLEDDRPLLPERCVMVPQAVAAFEHDTRIGSFGLFAYWDSERYLQLLAEKGCTIVDKYKHLDLDIYLLKFSEAYPWSTFCFNDFLIRSKIVDGTAILGRTALHIGELESVMARKVKDGGYFAAYSPQLHAVAEDMDPGHSKGWNILKEMGM